MNVYIHIYILLSLKECFNLILISLFSSLSLVQKFLIIFIPKLFPEQLPVPSPSCFLFCFFFLTHQEQSVMPKYSWMHGFPMKHAPLTEATLLEKTVPTSPRS